MTEKRDISRRKALKGIAGAGSLVGGLGLAGSASASGVRDQDQKKQIADVSFNGCGSVTIAFRKGTIFPFEGIQFTFYSPKANAVKVMTPKIRYQDTEPGDGEHGSKRRTFTFGGTVKYNHAAILAVSVGTKVYENPNSCKEKGGIDLDGVCLKKDKNRGKFLVTNHTGKSAKLTWKEVDGKQSGTVTVPKNGTEAFWVPLDGKSETKVALYYDGKKVAVATAAAEHCT